MKTETITCDIKGCDNEIKPESNSILKKEYKKTSIQIIFTTEQTEGRNVTPHLSMEQLDICDKCMANLLKGNYIYGAGAMGYNTYWFTNTVKLKS